MDWLSLLERIGVNGAEATLATLKHLQRQALLSLPFENLDIHLGRQISLDREAIYRKVITNGRGGFCYELNECFYQCLMGMGYEVERLEGRVELGGAGAPFDHQCTLVRLDGKRWMADIGMGDSALSPLDLDSHEPQTDGKSWYRVDERDGLLEIYRQFHPNEWSKMLILNLEPQPWGSFADRCYWQQTAPDSAFVHKRMCTLATEDGRVSLIGNTLKEIGESSSEMQIPESEYISVLSTRFGINLTSPIWRFPLGECHGP